MSEYEFFKNVHSKHRVVNESLDQKDLRLLDGNEAGKLRRSVDWKITAHFVSLHNYQRKFDESGVVSAGCITKRYFRLSCLGIQINRRDRASTTFVIRP